MAHLDKEGCSSLLKLWQLAFCLTGTASFHNLDKFKWISTVAQMTYHVIAPIAVWLAQCVFPPLKRSSKNGWHIWVALSTQRTHMFNPKVMAAARLHFPCPHISCSEPVPLRAAAPPRWRECEHLLSGDSFRLRNRSHVTTVENHCDWITELTAGMVWLNKDRSQVNPLCTTPAKPLLSKRRPKKSIGVSLTTVYKDICHKNAQQLFLSREQKMRCTVWP